MESQATREQWTLFVKLVARAARRAERGAEVFTAMKLFLWGGFVLLPARSFATPAYGELVALAPEYVHGGLAFLLGAALVALLERPGVVAWRARRVALFLAIVAWLQVAIGFGVVRLFSTATLSYSLDAAVAVVAFHYVSNRRPRYGEV